MDDLIRLSKSRMRRIEPYFPPSHGRPRVDDRRIVSGIILVIRNSLRWRYNRFITVARFLHSARDAEERAEGGPGGAA